MDKIQKIGLIGGPNSGKTSLFNLLSGLRQKTGNFPGVTVDRVSATINLSSSQKVNLIDFPGCYSIYSKSEDEKIVSSILRNPEHEDFPDFIVLVADVTNIKRSLVLCSQLVDMGFPVLVCLSMTDMVSRERVEFIEELIKSRFGLSVVSISTKKKQGIEGLKNAMREPIKPSKADKIFKVPQMLEAPIKVIKAQFGVKNDYLAFQAIIDSDNYFPEEGKWFDIFHDTHKLTEVEGLISNELLVRNENIGTLLEDGRDLSSLKPDFSWKADKVLLHPVWGYVIFLGIMGLVFQSIFTWASLPMEWIDSLFGSMGSWVEETLPGGFATDLLVNGVLAGLGGIVIFVPQIAFLFLFIALLEESGYMSRVVFLMDRLVSPFGLSGKSVIPLIGGMACAVPSIIVTRNIESRTERLITIMVTPLMSCSARIPVYTLLIGMFIPSTYLFGVVSLQGLVMMGMYLLGVVMVLLVALIFSFFLEKNKKDQFVSELPLYRFPSIKSVFVTIFNKCKSFVLEAGKIILVISIILWFMASFGPGEDRDLIEKSFSEQLVNVNGQTEKEKLELKKNSDMLRASYAGKLGEFIEPVIRPLGYDWKIGIALITSFAAREVFVGTMATLYSVGEEGMDFSKLREKMKREVHHDSGKPVYTLAVGLSLLIFYAFAMQCMSTLAIVKKETHSWKWTSIMLVYLTVLAYGSAFLVFVLFS